MSKITRRTALAAGAGLALAAFQAPAAEAGRDLVRRLRGHCEKLARDDAFSGAVMLGKEGRMLFRQAYGLRNRSETLANAPDTKFNIASIGKMFTALCILRYVEAGRLRLDAPLGEAWPDYPDRTVAERITLHQILTHTAGLGNHFMFKSKAGYTASATQTDYLPLFAKEGLSGEPGTVAYSNDGYVLLGALIEQLSGKDFRDHCRDEIFSPLGMDDTGFHAPDDIVANLALPYVRDLERPGVWRSAIATEGLPGGASGGGHSTVPDLSRFAAALRANRLLSPEGTRAFTAGRVPMRNGQYGYGIQSETINGRRAFGHTGGHYGVAGEVLIVEDSGDVFIVLSNGEVEPYWDLANFIRTEIAGETEASRNYAFTRALIAATQAQGPDAGIALCNAHAARQPREGVIDVYAFRAWHGGDAGGAEHLLKFNRMRFPDSLSALWSLAEFYRYARRATEAIAAYRAFLARQPGDADALSAIERLGG